MKRSSMSRPTQRSQRFRSEVGEMSRLARLRSPPRQKRGAITYLKAVLEPCRKSAAGVEAGAWLGIAVLAAPAAALAEPLRTAQSAVELLPLCTRPNKETVFGTEDQAKASCQAGMRKIAMPGCPAVWLCEAAAPKASYSTQYRTREEAQANCSNGVVRGVIYPEWYWYCDPIPPGTSAAKDIFQGSPRTSKRVRSNDRQALFRPEGCRETARRESLRKGRRCIQSGAKAYACCRVRSCRSEQARKERWRAANRLSSEPRGMHHRKRAGKELRTAGVKIRSVVQRGQNFIQMAKLRSGLH